MGHLSQGHGGAEIRFFCKFFLVDVFPVMWGRVGLHGTLVCKILRRETVGYGQNGSDLFVYYLLLYIVKSYFNNSGILLWPNWAV